MLPMGQRTIREADAQLQYEPFRNTVFTPRRDDLASMRGPGALFHKEWNSLAGNAQRHKSLSLYRTERDVNPTPTATVQTFYDPQESSDVSSQLKKKGNTVVCLKSSVPRFNGALEETKAPKCGPGSYYPDRYNGAFPALFDKMTPHSARAEKLQAKRVLAATFGIVPVASSPGATLTLVRRHTAKGGDGSTDQQRTLADFPLESTRLAPTFTPRTAYQNPENRKSILAMRPRNSVSSTT